MLDRWRMAGAQHNASIFAVRVTVKHRLHNEKAHSVGVG
jgi:hypothetical protein